MSHRPGADSIIADRRLVITLVTLVVILPLCFPRELGALAWVSMAAVSLAPPCSLEMWHILLVQGWTWIFAWLHHEMQTMLSRTRPHNAMSISLQVTTVQTSCHLHRGRLLLRAS